MNAPARGEASQTLVEHFFRHESGRLTAVLMKRFGAQRLQQIEDSVQHAFERALGTWNRAGVPDEPSAWLNRAATNHLLDQLRREKVANLAGTDAPPAGALGDGVEEFLALLFSCADERLAPRARLILCLKMVSGFSTEEIAARLFMSGAAVQKALERGRRQLARHYEAERRAGGDQQERLQTVLLVLYLQFNEGASLGRDESGLRVELCDEAIRLTRMLATHRSGNTAGTWGLLALMHLSVARLPARLGADGILIPLEQQDRSLWDRHHIRLGLEAWRVGVSHDAWSHYLVEAAIQVEHALAPRFEDTRFGEIVSLYETLEQRQPSPVYALNRIIALAEVEGAERALDLLEREEFPPWFRDHYLYHGTRGELLRRLGVPEAREQLLQAAALAPSQIERRFFEAKAKTS